MHEHAFLCPFVATRVISTVNPSQLKRAFGRLATPTPTSSPRTYTEVANNPPTTRGKWRCRRFTTAEASRVPIGLSSSTLIATHPIPRMDPSPVRLAAPTPGNRHRQDYHHRHPVSTRAAPTPRARAHRNGLVTDRALFGFRSS